MPFEIIDVTNISGIQSIKLPVSFMINCEKVYIKKVGNALYIIPFQNPWQSLIESVNDFSPDFMEQRNNLVTHQIRDEID